MRIVGGTLKGRSLKGPSNQDIRPTSDRLREAIFNILAHGDLSEADPVKGARVIDLFAGTGALAFEALSRGASFALMVDEGSQARALLRENTESLGLGGVTRIFRRDACRLGAAPPGPPFTLAFLDPPYGKNLVPPALVSLREGGWLAPNALVVVEEMAQAVVEAQGFRVLERRDYGETAVTFLGVG